MRLIAREAKGWVLRGLASRPEAFLTTAARIKVLIAEDEALIGLDLTDILTTSGYHVVGPAMTTDEALHLLENENPHLALIDPLLRDGPCLDLLQKLRDCRVPFVIHSGLGSDLEFSAHWDGAPTLEKPASPEHIIAALAKIERS